MIGIGPLVSAAAAVLLVGGLVGPGDQGPATAVRSDEIVTERRAEALDALDAVAAALHASLESARRAADAVLSGSEDAGAHLAAAAEALDGAGDEARAAREAIAALDAARRARGEDPRPPPTAVTDAELRAISEELRLAGPAADDAARLRRGSDGVLARLDLALAAAVDGRSADARREVDLARADHEALSASATISDVLPVWLDATDAMISAVTSLIDATAAGDRAAADAAAEDFALVAEDAATADRALRIAVTEAADAATAAPLARIGSALATVEAARAEIAGEDPTP